MLKEHRSLQIFSGQHLERNSSLSNPISTVRVSSQRTKNDFEQDCLCATWSTHTWIVSTWRIPYQNYTWRDFVWNFVWTSNPTSTHDLHLSASSSTKTNFLEVVLSSLRTILWMLRTTEISTSSEAMANAVLSLSIRKVLSLVESSKVTFYLFIVDGRRWIFFVSGEDNIHGLGFTEVSNTIRGWQCQLNKNIAWECQMLSTIEGNTMQLEGAQISSVLNTE